MQSNNQSSNFPRPKMKFSEWKQHIETKFKNQIDALDTPTQTKIKRFEDKFNQLINEYEKSEEKAEDKII